MLISDLFKPKLKRSNPSVREKAIEKLKDQQLLTVYAKNDPDPGVRKACIIKLNDRDAIRSILKNDNSASVRLAALTKMTDQDVFIETAKNDADILVVQFAVSKINNQTTLAYLATNHSNDRVRKLAVEKLIDEGILKSIAMKDKNAEVRLAAVEKIHDQTFLETKAEFDDNTDVCKAALSAISDREIKLRINRVIYKKEVARREQENARQRELRIINRNLSRTCQCCDRDVYNVQDFIAECKRNGLEVDLQIIRVRIRHVDIFTSSAVKQEYDNYVERIRQIANPIESKLGYYCASCLDVYCWGCIPRGYSAQKSGIKYPMCLHCQGDLVHIYNWQV